MENIINVLEHGIQELEILKGKVNERKGELEEKEQEIAQRLRPVFQEYLANNENLEILVNALRSIEMLPDAEKTKQEALEIADEKNSSLFSKLLLIYFIFILFCPSFLIVLIGAFGLTALSIIFSCLIPFKISKDYNNLLAIIMAQKEEYGDEEEIKNKIAQAKIERDKLYSFGFPITEELKRVQDQRVQYQTLLNEIDKTLVQFREEYANICLSNDSLDVGMGVEDMQKQVERIRTQIHKLGEE